MSPPTREKALRRLRWSRPEPSLGDDDVDVGRRFRESLQDGDIHSLVWRRAAVNQGCQMAKFDPFLSLDCAMVEGVGAQSKERKGSNFAAQRSGAIVQKPEGPNTYDLKIWL